MKKFKLDIESAEGIAIDVLRQHHKWTAKRINKIKKNIDSGSYYHHYDLVNDLRLESHLREVIEYFGEHV